MTQTLTIAVKIRRYEYWLCTSFSEHIQTKCMFNILLFFLVTENVSETDTLMFVFMFSAYIRGFMVSYVGHMDLCSAIMWTCLRVSGIF